MWELICENRENIRDSLVRVKWEHVRDSLVRVKRELVREKTF